LRISWNFAVPLCVIWFPDRFIGHGRQALLSDK
jgi:hypothetical protein